MAFTIPRMTHVEAREPYRIFVRYDDGVEGEDDLGPRIWGPMFEPLKDPAFFARVILADYGAPLWPNGLDLCPVSIYERITKGTRGAGVARAG
jgi:hypothetical protein